MVLGVVAEGERRYFRVCMYSVSATKKRELLVFHDEKFYFANK